MPTVKRTRPAAPLTPFERFRYARLVPPKPARAAPPAAPRPTTDGPSRLMAPGPALLPEVLMLERRLRAARDADVGAGRDASADAPACAGS